MATTLKSINDKLANRYGGTIYLGYSELINSPDIPENTETAEEIIDRIKTKLSQRRG